MATHALPASHLRAASPILPASHIGNDEAARAPARVSLLRRLYIAILVSQSRRAQIEIGRKLGPGALQRALRKEFPPRC